MNEKEITINNVLISLINQQKASRAGELKTRAVRAQNFERAVKLREIQKHYESQPHFHIPHYRELGKHLQ